MAAGIGSLVELGMGSWTGLNTHGIALGALPLPAFARPDITDFLWTIPLAVAIAVGTFVIFRLGLRVEGIVTRRRVVLTTVAGLVIAGLAIAFSEATDHSVNEVLFSGQDALPGLVTRPAGAYSLGALALLVAFKGLAYGLSLGSFRGGPIFPAMFLGAAAGIMASHLPGFELTPAVSVGIGAAVAAALRLPLAAVVLHAVVLTSQSGPGAGPLIIVGVIVSYLTTLAISGPEPPASQGGEGAPEGGAQPAPAPAGG